MQGPLWAVRATEMPHRAGEAGVSLSLRGLSLGQQMEPLTQTEALLQGGQGSCAQGAHPRPGLIPHGLTTPWEWSTPFSFTSHFTDVTTEAQRGGVTCPGPHSQELLLLTMPLQRWGWDLGGRTEPLPASSPHLPAPTVRLCGPPPSP